MLSILDYPDKKEKERRAERGIGTSRGRKGNGREKEEIGPEGEGDDGAEEVCVVVVSCKVNYSKDLEREQSRRRQ